MTEAEKEAEKRRLDAEDERIVDDEIHRYRAAGVINDNSPEMEDFDLLRYWQVCCFAYKISRYDSHII